MSEIFYSDNLDEFSSFYKNETNYILIDKAVFNIYKNDIIKNIKGKLIFILFDAKEENKNLEYISKIIGRLIQNGIRRGDTLIVIGGGVTLDLGSFIASILYRGIEHILIPTTLLAMVDASYGGKTGINFENHKNYIGSFYKPTLIYYSFDFLKSNNDDMMKNGYGEVIKYLLLENEDFTDLDLKALIKKSIDVKKKYADNDFYDNGVRMFLNLGHTFGHVIELKYKLTHGIAVLEGISLIFDLMDYLGYDTVNQRRVFSKYLNIFGISLIKYNFKDYIEDIFYDKKNIKNKLNLILLDSKLRPFIKIVTKDDFEDLL